MKTPENRYGNPAESQPEVFRFKSSTFFENPYPYYNRLRATDPIHWNEQGNAWMVTRHADVDTLLKDPRLSVRRSTKQQETFPPHIQEELQPLYDFYSSWLMFQDPPEHGMIKKATMKPFSRKATGTYRGAMDERVGELVADIEPGSRIDILHDFAEPLSVDIIGGYLGVSRDDMPLVKEWSDHLVGYLGKDDPTVDDARGAQRSLSALQDYLDHQVVDKEHFDPEGIIGHLEAAHSAGHITKEDVYATYANILVDGHEPIANSITNGLNLLLQHPDQLAVLRDNPELITPMVDELLRLEPPFQYSRRIATDDIEIGGKKIEKGKKVLLMLNSANRDPEVFSNPDSIDITRENNNHRSFGFGVHYCIGHTLARPAVESAVNGIVQGFPNLQPTDEKLEWVPSLGYRALKSLPVQV